MQWTGCTDMKINDSHKVMTEIQIYEKEGNID